MSWVLAATVAVALTSSGDECRREELGKLTLTEATPVEAILDQPDAYVGKAVRVEGTVTDVCEMAGCWLELKAGEAGRTLRVKVQDGEIVFPKTSRGRHAAAEGVVEGKTVTREQYESHLRHIADEQGRDFDPATVGEGPYRVLQIRGTGAEVCR